MMWRIYDIIYETPRGDLPTEIHVEINKFEWFNDIPTGLGNLNSKLGRIIREVTGSNSISCKYETLKK